MSSAASIPWIGAGVVSSLIFSSSIVLAEPMREPGDRLLLAQQVVNGLPPPPPSFGQGVPPAQSNPQLIMAPNMSAPAVPGAQQYLVIVNGDSGMMLNQVRSIEPGAFVQEYQGRRMIQAGMFGDINGAQQQVAALAGRGIGAQVVTVPGRTGGMAPSGLPGVSTVGMVPQVTAPALPTPASFPSPTTAQAAPQVTAPMLPPPDLLPVAPVPREVEFGQPQAPEQFVNPAPAPSFAPSGEPLPPDSIPEGQNGRSFYVVIPGKSEELPAISNQIMRLGDGFGIAQMVQASDAPRGPHVRVGPFVDRSAARRWTRYFRDFGLDARLFYTR